MHFGIEFWDVADAISTIRLGKLIKKSNGVNFDLLLTLIELI